MSNPTTLFPAQSQAQATRTPGIHRDIEYANPGGHQLLLDAGVPDGAGPFPIVLFVHGGGWHRGNKSADIIHLFEPVRSAGFLWFSINYRLAPANRWPACFDDVRSAIRWVKAHATQFNADPHRIATAGYSAGGQMVCLSAGLATDASDPHRVQAVIAIAAPTDFDADIRKRGGIKQNLQDLLNVPFEPTPHSLKLGRDLSPINHIHAGLPPFLLVHGDKDTGVPYETSPIFLAKLLAAGVRAELLTVPNCPHDINTWDATASIDYKKMMIDWLRTNLPAPVPAH